MTPRPFPESQIHALAERAKASLPAAVNGRIAKAVRLVQSASVVVHQDGRATVRSATDGVRTYTVAQGTCDCPDFQSQAPEGWCAHRIAAGMAQRLSMLAQAARSEAPATPGAPDTPDTHVGPSDAKNGVPNIPEALTPFVVWIQQKPFVRYAGLLQLAHARGLVALQEHWTCNEPELSLAHAVAVFADGRRFEGSGDASPSTVARHVAPHFRRVALTRAKARALRDALNLDLIAVEE